MIDLDDVRERPEAYKEACTKKGIKFDVDAFLALDREVRTCKQTLEALRSQQNAFNKELPKLQGEAKQSKLAEMKTLSAKAKEDETGFKLLEEQWKSQQLRLPGIPLDKVPVGKSDADNVESRKWGEIPNFSFPIKDHIELGKSLDILDFERGVKIAGTRSYFLKGDGARLQHAVLSFSLDFMHRKGYLVMDPPHIVRYEAMMGTGYFPGGEDQAYHLDDRDKDLFLIGTSEVSVASYHQDELLQESDLPKRYAGYSPCYRREAGSYGKDTQGLYRVHQFYKVEQVVICKNDAEESARFHAELLANSEEVIRALNVPYRVVEVCTGDMGQGQIYKNDIEVWMPSRKGYGETHSCSTFHEFQARRLDLRYKDSKGKNIFCHTLNNTLIASPRVLIPLLELNQQPDGSVLIPEALRPYMGGQERITKK
jgi:seryl-tRNA synthetase